MSKIEELIAVISKQEIKRFPLWKVTAWDKKFNGVEKYMQPKVVKYHYLLAKELSEIEVEGGDIRILYTTLENAYTTSELAKGHISEGEIVAIPWGGNPCVKYYKGKFVTGDNRIATSTDTDTLDNKYLYYWMFSQLDTIKGFYRGAGIQHPSMKSILCMEIPLPPLPVQQEIVRILDSFTDLQENLQQELEARKKQLDHRRDEWFCTTIEEMEERANKKEFELKRLSDLGSLTRGKRFVKADSVDEGAPCMHYGEIYTYYGLSASKARSHITYEQSAKLRHAQKNDVVIVGAGENNVDIGIGVAWFGDEPVTVHDACYTFHHTEDPMYISHFLRSAVYHTQIKKNVSEGKICSISAEGVGRAIIPIPSLEKQREIVALLNASEELILNIQGEIAARQKQYEYYRETLLSF